MKVGYWATHKYKRHSVERDVEEFVGWQTLQKMMGLASHQRDGAFAATCFETGGRVSEVRMLHRENFVLDNPKVLLVTKMRVLKRFHREQDEEGERKVVKDVGYRKTFPIRRDDPLAQPLLEWVENKSGFLFLGRGGEPYISRAYAYRICRQLGQAVGLWIYPHWFRAQRASQLHSQYDFDAIDLKEYFAWKDDKTAMRYAKLGWRGLADKMGVK
jgi:integrase